MGFGHGVEDSAELSPCCFLDLLQLLIFALSIINDLVRAEALDKLRGFSTSRS